MKKDSWLTEPNGNWLSETGSCRVIQEVWLKGHCGASVSWITWWAFSCFSYSLWREVTEHDVRDRMILSESPDAHCGYKPATQWLFQSAFPFPYAIWLSGHCCILSSTPPKTIVIGWKNYKQTRASFSLCNRMIIDAARHFSMRDYSDSREKNTLFRLDMASLYFPISFNVMTLFKPAKLHKETP